MVDLLTNPLTRMWLGGFFIGLGLGLFIARVLLQKYLS